MHSSWLARAVFLSALPVFVHSSAVRSVAVLSHAVQSHALHPNALHPNALHSNALHSQLVLSIPRHSSATQLLPDLSSSTRPFSLQGGAAPKPGAKAPRPKDPKLIVEELFALERFRRDLGPIDAALAELESIELRSAAEIKEWSSRLAKAFATGAKLEKKSGRAHFWPKTKTTPDKGLFYVSGETNSPKGLLIAMHGGGKGSGDATLAQAILESSADRNGWLLIAPQVLERTERGWTDSGTEEFVLQLVDAALRTWKIDRDRVYLAGHSMGGYGSWVLGAHHADRVAALAPSAGAPTPVYGPGGALIDIQAGVVPSLRNVPMAIYQSDDDPNVPPDANREAVRRLVEARGKWGGYEHEYWEVPSRQHELPPGGMEALIEKIQNEKRDPRPTKVVWQPTLPWKRQFYWLWWSKPVADALVVAEFDRARNEVHVTCDGSAQGLEVLLDERMVDLAKEVVVKLGDKEVFRGVPKADLATLTKTWLTGDPALAFAYRVKLVP